MCTQRCSVAQIGLVWVQNAAMARQVGRCAVVFWDPGVQLLVRLSQAQVATRTFSARYEVEIPPAIALDVLTVLVRLAD